MLLGHALNQDAWILGRHPALQGLAETWTEVYERQGPLAAQRLLEQHRHRARVDVQVLAENGQPIIRGTSRPRCRLRGAPSGSRAPTALATPDRRLHQPDHRRNLPVHLPYSASRTAGLAPRQPGLAAECAGHRSGGADRLQPAADAVHHPTAGSPAPCRARPRPDDLSAAVAGAPGDPPRRARRAGQRFQSHGCTLAGTDRQPATVAARRVPRIALAAGATAHCPGPGRARNARRTGGDLATPGQGMRPPGGVDQRDSGTRGWMPSPARQSTSICPICSNS